MWKVTIKGLLAHKLRLALTAIAIVLGVTFVSGTLVLTDTLRNTFTTLFSNVYQNVDFQVRGVAQFGSNGSAQRNPIPESLVTTVRSVPGVAAAEGQVGGYAQYVARNGKAISNGGAPTIGISFDPDPRISALHVIEGTKPTSANDVVMDQSTAQKYHFAPGQHVRILLAGPSRTFTISGIARFGQEGNLAGATIAAFTLPEAQVIFDRVGQLGTINVVTTPGADKAQVQQAIARVLPHGVEVVTGQTVVNEQTNSVNQALSFFNIALLVFAFIALFVGAFTILNTFSIIVGQRTRELALLRIVGASRRQVFRSVLAEAAIVGLVSSLVGIALGVVAAIGLEALLRGFGIDLPSGAPVFAVRTVIVGLVVGVGVTVVAAISPARRAVRIAPVAALSDQQQESEAPSRRRLVRGLVALVVGAACLGIGLSAPKIQLVGLGAIVLFIAVAMLSSLIARPLASALGRPIAAVFGMAGKLGRENSMRNPRRTAQTASALMVGLALVSAIAVFGASLSKSATSSVDNAVRADLIVSTGNSGPGQFSTTIPALLAKVPGVTASTTVYGGEFEFQRSIVQLRAVSTKDLSKTIYLNMTSGSTAALAKGEMLIDANTASADHLQTGDTASVRFAKTGRSRVRIGGIFAANALVGSYVVGDAFYLSHFETPLPGAVLLRTNGSASVEKTVTAAMKPFPTVQVQTRAEFDKAQTQQVNQLLGLIYALLSLAVIIALTGIVNTLVLSVLERTREIGLLRAVGMKRRQVRAMIRTEALIMAIFGAIIGIVVGTCLGVALVASLRSQGITETVIPISNLIIFLVLAALLGLVAASRPARRAAKLDVLAAISTQ